MTESRPDRESKLDRIVHQYYQAIENGRSVDIQRFIDSHPEFRVELKSFFADVDHLGHVSGGGLAGTVGLDQPHQQDEAVKEVGPGTSLTYVGEYRIIEEVARGGMGVVFKARQEKLKRNVALKMILSGRFASETEVDRFRREARATAALNHPNIVGVHEIGVHEGNHYFTMDYIESKSLSDRLREGSLAPRDAATLLETLARATEYAHKKGVLHRDLKPANVLIDLSDQPHITDFGLAKAIAESGERSETEITRSGQIVGTPSYMAPEQAAAKHQLVSVVSDVYSLGAILYACLSGRAPFVAESTVETLRQVIHDDPLPTRVLNPRVPKDLETICLKCLSKEPRHRYPTAEDLADDLKRFLEGRTVVARPIGVLAKTWRIAKRNPWASLATSLMFLIAVVSPVVAIQQHRQSGELAIKAGRITKQKNEIVELLEDKELALDRAIDAEKVASESAEKEKSQSRLNRRLLYISDMQRMASLYQDADIQAMRAKLARHVPGPNEPDPINSDLRDFEWYYWFNMSESQLDTWKRDAAAEYIAVSPNGEWVAAGNSILHKGAFRAVSVQIWNVAADRVEQQLTLRGDWIGGLRFSEDGQQLGVIIGAVEQWIDWRRDEVKQTNKVASFAAASPKNRYAVSASNHLMAMVMDNSVRCFDLQTVQPLRIMIRDSDDETLRRRNPKVIRESAEGKYVEFQKIVSGTTQRRSGNEIFRGSVPGRSMGNVWSNTDEFAPDPRTDGGPVFALAVSPNDDRLVVGTRDGRVIAWDLTTGEQAMDFAAHQGIVWDMAFSPDGRSLATVADDGHVRLWAVSSGRLQREWQGHNDRVCHVEFGRDGNLATGSDDRTVRVWNLLEDHPVRTFRGHEDRITCIRFSTDGRSIWSASQDGQVLHWTTQPKDHAIKVVEGQRLRCVSHSDDGRYLAASGTKGAVTIWDLNSNDPPATMYANQAALLHLRFVPDSQQLIGIGLDGTLSRWDITTHLIQEQRSFSFHGRQSSPNSRVSNIERVRSSVAISPDGRKLAMYAENDLLQIFDTNDPDASPIEIGKGWALIDPTFSPQGKHLMVTSRSKGKGTLRIFETNTGAPVDEFTIDADFAHHASFSRDGNRLTCLTRSSGTTNEQTSAESIVVWDRQTTEKIIEIPVVGARSLAISADGSMVAAAIANETSGEARGKHPDQVHVRRVSDGSEIYVLDVAATAIQFAPDESSLIVADTAGKLQIYNLADGSKRTSLVRPAGRITSVSYSPQKRELAASVNSLNPIGWFNVPWTRKVTVALDDVELKDARVIGKSPLNGQSKKKLIYLPDGRLEQRGLLWTLCGLDAETIAQHRLVMPENVVIIKSSERIVRERPAIVPDTFAPAANACFFLAPDRTLFRANLGDNGETVCTPEPLPGTATCTTVAATTDGRLIALALDEEIQIRDGASLELIHSIQAHKGAIRTLSFRQDGSLLASGGADRVIRIWETTSGTLQASVRSHSRPITCVRFSPRGTTVVSASYDGEIHLSDVSTGEVKTILGDHEGPVHWIEFSPTGDEFASAGEDGTIRRWQAATDDGSDDLRTSRPE